MNANKQRMQESEVRMCMMISTYVIAFEVFFFILKFQTIWSYILLLHLFCMLIVMVSPQCTNESKYIWLAIKFMLFILICIFQWKHLKFGLKYILPATLVALLYLNLVNIEEVYGCHVYTMQYCITFCISSFAYMLLSTLHIKLSSNPS